MKKGTFYGIGIGPGDPDLITVKGAEILSACRHIFTRKILEDPERSPEIIAKKHMNPEARIHEIGFPGHRDRSELSRGWDEAAHRIAEVLETGEDACFLSRGDALLYSTYDQLLKALRRRISGVEVVTIPGITAWGAAAAVANFPVGRGKEITAIVPSSDDLEGIRRALSCSGTVVVLEIGHRMGGILDILEGSGAMGRSVFVSRAGMDKQLVESDLRNLRGRDAEINHLSTILISVKTEQPR
jgi:precorrin-2/cobalt-factor-2 C20-methyltransferase